MSQNCCNGSSQSVRLDEGQLGWLIGGQAKWLLATVVPSQFHGGSLKRKPHCTSTNSLTWQQTHKLGIKPELGEGKNLPTRRILGLRLKQGYTCTLFIPLTNGKFRVITTVPIPKYIFIYHPVYLTNTYHVCTVAYVLYIIIPAYTYKQDDVKCM